VVDDRGSLRSSSQEKVNNKFQTSVEHIDEGNQSYTNHNQALLQKIKNRLFEANNILPAAAKYEQPEVVQPATSSYKKARALPAAQSSTINQTINVEAASGAGKSLSYYKSLNHKSMRSRPRTGGDPDSLVYGSDADALFDQSLVAATLASPLPAQIHHQRQRRHQQSH